MRKDDFGAAALDLERNFSKIEKTLYVSTVFHYLDMHPSL